MPKEDSMEGVLIVYRLGPGPPARVVRFAERVLGQDRKRNGKMYRRKGLLDELPHWKVAPSVLLVRREDGRKVVREIRRWTGQVNVWSVTLTRRERRLLKARQR